MDDSISRKMAIDTIDKHIDTFDAIDTNYLCGLRTAMSFLKEMPSAQPERKKGKWINANDGKWNTVEVLKCSVCGEMDNRMYRTDNYCPNCGADMRGEQDED